MKKLLLILMAIFSIAFFSYGQGELSVDGAITYIEKTFIDSDEYHFNGYFDGYFTLSADAWVIWSIPYGGTFAWARSEITRYGYTQKQVEQINNTDLDSPGIFDDYDGEIDYIYVDVSLTVCQPGDWASADATIKWW